MDWTEAYRPKRMADVVGNGPAVARMQAWAAAWKAGVPERRALILAGPPGVGKTSAAHALAHDMGWAVVELDASDARNATAIRKVAMAGALNASLTDAGDSAKRKLIIVDEADNLVDREREEGSSTDASLLDSGGKAELVDTARRTKQPLILIVNDLYALEKGSGAPLKAVCETLKFQRLQARQVVPALQRIAAAVGVQAEPAALESIAARAEGDLRASVRDLEALARGRTTLSFAQAGAAGKRDASATMFDVVRLILKGARPEELRIAIDAADTKPDDLILWVDENIPKEFRDPQDLARAYDVLSRADRYLGRARRRQIYGLWSYASQLQSFGVMAQRTKENREFVPFGFPQYLSRMGRTKGSRAAKDELAERLGQATHQSKRKCRGDQVEMFQAMFAADEEFAVHQTAAMELDDDQVALLLGDHATAGRLKQIRMRVDAMAPPLETPAKRKAEADETLDEEAAPRRAAKPAGDEKPAKPKPSGGQKSLF